MRAMLQRFVNSFAQAVRRRSVAFRNRASGRPKHGHGSHALDVVDEFNWEPAAAPVFLTGDYAGQPAAALNAGDSVSTPAIAVHFEHRIYLAIVANPGEPASVLIQHSQGKAGRWCDLATAHLLAGPHPQQLEVSLGALAGQVCSFRIASANREGAICHVVRFSICTPQHLGRLNALSAYESRMRNEVQNFSGAAYTHTMYGERSAAPGGAGEVNPAIASEKANAHETKLLESRARETLSQLAPAPGEAAFNYALRTLGALLPMAAPDFFERARELSAKKPLRILSICAGAARVEEQILDHCSGPVELTLLDASPDLIGRAADRLADGKPGRQVRCLIGDVNAGLPGEGRFDIIVCVSALHHVADLEKVLGQINQRLHDDGEFWSIGEQIGRNGNRLWPDAYEAANRAFSLMPERLRRNAHTGRVDALLSDRDFSIGCFEGIRSEELETLLDAYLVPVQVYKRNAFLWRLVDATYSDNFDLTNSQDLEQLRALVIAEAVHWACGGRSTELHGVYRRKYLQ
jgi:SAM-dependent methyltransferase